MSQDLIFNEKFGEFSGPLVPNFVVRQVEIDQGSVETQPWSHQFEKFIIDQVAS